MVYSNPLVRLNIVQLIRYFVLNGLVSFGDDFLLVSTATAVLVEAVFAAIHHRMS